MRSLITCIRCSVYVHHKYTIYIRYGVPVDARGGPLVLEGGLGDVKAVAPRGARFVAYIEQHRLMDIFLLFRKEATMIRVYSNINDKLTKHIFVE